MKCSLCTEASHIIESIRVQEKQLENNVVGHFFKWALGTMDSDDEQDIKGKFLDLEQDGWTRKHLLKQQVSVMRSNFDTIAKPVQDIIADEIRSRRAHFISELNQSFYDVKNETNKLIRESKLLSLLTSINTKLIGLKSQQNVEKPNKKNI